MRANNLSDAFIDTGAEPQTQHLEYTRSHDDPLEQLITFDSIVICHGHDLMSDRKIDFTPQMWVLCNRSKS